MKTNDLKIALVLITMLLSGCLSGGTSSRINVTRDYLDQLIAEQPTIQECCPATQEVVKDWIMQNAP